MWGFPQHFSGETCEFSHRSISQNLFILLMVIAAFVLLVMFFTTIVFVKRNQKRHRGSISDYEKQGKGSFKLTHLNEIRK